jgi:hypothetical protein
MATASYTGSGSIGGGSALTDAQASYVLTCILDTARTTIGKDELAIVGLKNDCLALGVVTLSQPLTGADTDRATIANALNGANSKKMTKVVAGRDLDDDDILDTAKALVEDWRKGKTLDGKHVFLLDSSSGNSFCVALREKPGSGTMRAPSLPAFTTP